MSTAILFSPAGVAHVLTGLPSVAALLPDPALEGGPSEAFPGVLRKTDREVYRWIAKTHYEHLVEAVEHLECSINWTRVERRSVSCAATSA